MQTSLLTNFSFLQKFAHAILNLAGWRVDTFIPNEKKYIIVGAHHTTNWDLPLALLFSLASGIKFNFLAKDEIFWGPVGYVMRKLGGLPVNRRANTHFVTQIAEEFHKRENLVIGITPEGTRKKTAYWKTGFYYIALTAKVPIALAYFDYPNRRVGIGKMITPTGNLEADLDLVREFYADKKGKYPSQHGEIRVRPTDLKPDSHA